MSKSNRRASMPRSEHKVRSSKIGKRPLFQPRRKPAFKGQETRTESDISWESYVSELSSIEDCSSCVSDASSIEETDTELKDQIDDVVQAPVDEDGEDCELHIYESRYDTRGEEVLLRVGTKSKINLEKNRSPRASLVLTRYYSRFNKGFHTTLKVQSKRIIKALKHIIDSYPGENFYASTVYISTPPKCLFHYQKELRAYADACEDIKDRDHISLCLKYMEKTMPEEIKFLEEALADPIAFHVSQDDLWVVFKPGCLIYQKKDGMELVSKLQTISQRNNIKDEVLGWNVWVERVVYNGEDFGHIEELAWISKFDGRKAVKHLEVFPLLFHPDADRIRSMVEQRGRKYLSFCGIHYCLYNGLAQFRDSFSDYDADLVKIHVSRRIMVDPKAYKHFEDDSWDDFVYGTRIPKKDPPQLSADQLMICTHEIHGYAFESKKWGIFNIEFVEDTTFNEDAFQGLIFEESKKKLIRSLVFQHGSESDDFDDLIKGKGKGLVFLLYGPPGVGKTLTAESISDLARRPLFVINSGDVVGKSNQEESLTSLLRLATSWNAVVLLDEADVFMQQRDPSTPTANELVAVLLRVIEYFEGILFLTSNRPASIDQAFRSRIHLALSYPPLSSSARRQLWEYWLVGTSSGKRPTWLGEHVLQQLSESNVNGREIKNIMRVAHALARNEKRAIEPTDVFQALEAHGHFQSDFEDGAGKQGKPTNLESFGLRLRLYNLFALLLVVFYLCEKITAYLSLSGAENKGVGAVSH